MQYIDFYFFFFFVGEQSDEIHEVNLPQIVAHRLMRGKN